MSRFDWISIVLTVIAVLIIPLSILMFRIAIKWTRTEDQIGELIGKVDTLVRDKEKVHTDMLKQMTDDRRATDRRLRWLEENIWDRRRLI